jgi:hypothetical protein
VVSRYSPQPVYEREALSADAATAMLNPGTTADDVDRVS